VSNVVDATLLAAEALQASGSILNIGCGQASSVLDLVAAIEEAGVRARQPGSDWKATVDPVAATALSAAEDDLATAKAASRATTSHLPLGQVRPGSRLLETERKLLTHAIRMSAYNTESALARLIRPHYSRGQEGARPAARGVHPAR